MHNAIEKRVCEDPMVLLMVAWAAVPLSMCSLQWTAQCAQAGCHPHMGSGFGMNKDSSMHVLASQALTVRVPLRGSDKPVSA